jgi:hypothetical protein
MAIKFKFIDKNGQEIREIYMNVFLQKVPSYILNATGMIPIHRERLSANAIKNYGQLMVTEMMKYTYYKPDLPFLEEEIFETLQFKYGIVNNEIHNLTYFYNCGTYKYFEPSVDSFIQIMRNIARSEYDEEYRVLLMNAANILEQWKIKEYSQIGWYMPNNNTAEKMDDDTYSLVFDIAHTFQQSGIDGFSGFWGPF